MLRVLVNSLSYWGSPIYWGSVSDSEHFSEQFGLCQTELHCGWWLPGQIESFPSLPLALLHVAFFALVAFTSICPSLSLIWEILFVSESWRLQWDIWISFHFLHFSSFKTVWWLSLMPLNDVTSAELAKLKGWFMCGFVCVCVCFHPLVFNDLWCCVKSWEILEMCLSPASLWGGFLTQILFSDP